MKILVVVALGFVSVTSLAAKPAVHHASKGAAPVASRLPVPLRQLLFRKFEDAIERAAEDGEKKYPTPDLSSGQYRSLSRADYNRYVAIQTRYVNRLTERYCSAVRKEYGVSSHEEDLIEAEGPSKDWHS